MNRSDSIQLTVSIIKNKSKIKILFIKETIIKNRLSPKPIEFNY